MEVVTGPSKNSVIPHDIQHCPLVARVQALCTYLSIKKHNSPTIKPYVSHMKPESSNLKEIIEDLLFKKLIQNKWKR